MQALVVDQMLGTMEGFVEGWLKTLGEAGKPTSTVSPVTRVKAAQTGLEFFMKLQGMQADGADANDLLRELTKLEQGANEYQPDGSETEDWLTDAEPLTEAIPLE